MKPLALVVGSIAVYLGGVLSAHVLFDRLPSVKDKWNKNNFGGQER